MITEINNIHFRFSEEYFNFQEQQNLKKDIKYIDESQIYKYRLYLHESINDYIMTSNIIDSNYVYRVKTYESIIYKINKFKERNESFPVNKYMNDIMGVRIIIEKDMYDLVISTLQAGKLEDNLWKYYEDSYKGLHIYFKNKKNYFYPWELQIWKKEDLFNNIASHKEHKRKFI